MVAKAKHHKPAGRRKSRLHTRATKVHAPKLQPPRSASLRKEEEKGVAPQENGFPRPEEGDTTLLAKPEREEPAPHVERERTSYDGDTAIKLYLREIGQVKLLTPQEEI